MYLILIITTGGGNITSQTIPQANMKQCLINQKNFTGDKLEKKEIQTLCIVGAK